MAATETSARANAVLDELYREHVGDVYRYTYAVLGNHADAEDVTQTTFVNALRALERGEIPEDPSRWLTVIAHNVVRQRWRQAAARPTLVELETDVADVEGDEEAFELEELVRALQRIPETQREAIVMRELEGRSYREIATVMGLSTSALETLLFRARRSLAEELENVVTCQNAELALSKRIDGRLSRKERRRLDEHLADCPDCARLAATQQRQRRAFKGLALLPLPIGLALFKGAPSAAAATSLPTIGLGTAGAGTPGAGATGAAGAGATAATTSGGAAVGGSLAGGLAVKVAVLLVTATVAAGVGYKGVQSIRHTPSKTPHADIEKTTGKTGAPAAAIAPGATHAADVKKAQVVAKRHGKPVSSPGRAKHGAPPQPALATSQSAETPGSNSAHAAASGSAPGAGAKPHQPTGGAGSKHVDSPTNPTVPAAGGKKPAAPKGGSGTPPGDRATNTPPAGSPATPKPPASGGSRGGSPAGSPGAPNGGSPGDTSAGAGQSVTTSSAAERDPAPTTGGSAPTGTPTQTQQPPAPSPSTPPAPTPSTTTPPPEQTPPGGTTETPPESSDDGHSNNGWDNGKKLGFYNENQDGKHLVTP